MSTAILGTGVAQAVDLESLYYSSDVDTAFTVAAGYCDVHWTLVGASGGASYDGAEYVDGHAGGVIDAFTPVTAGQEFTFGAGADGEDGDSEGGGVGGAGTYPGQAGDDVTEPGFDADGLPVVDVVGGDGGGGSAAWVASDGSKLVAFGGAGGGTGGGAGGPSAAPGVNTIDWSDAYGVDSGPAEFGYGSWVEAEVLPCIAAPLAPQNLVVVGGNGSLDVRFTPTWNDSANSSDADTWEYKLGNGDWTEVATSPVEYQSYRTFTLPGLTNGQSYAVQVRGVDDVEGPGDASNVVTAAPYAPIGAPGDVAVTTTATSVRVTWTAPTTAGTFPLVGYAVGMGAGEMGGDVCETDAAVLSCEITGVQSGVDYGMSVAAVDSEGHQGTRSDFVMTGKIPFPSTVPTSNGPLSATGISSGTVTAGQSVTVSGTGYAPYSQVSVLVYSTPTLLGSAEADANGAFSLTVTLPAGLAAGSHTLVAAGVDEAGNPRYLTMAITVAAATGGPGGLAYTGASVALPVIGGLGALVLGGGLVLAGRRRRMAA
jgi:hypothetical protein